MTQRGAIKTILAIVALALGTFVGLWIGGIRISSMTPHENAPAPALLTYQGHGISFRHPARYLFMGERPVPQGMTLSWSDPESHFQTTLYIQIAAHSGVPLDLLLRSAYEGFKAGVKGHGVTDANIKEESDVKATLGGREIPGKKMAWMKNDNELVLWCFVVQGKKQDVIVYFTWLMLEEPQMHPTMNSILESFTVEE